LRLSKHPDSTNFNSFQTAAGKRFNNNHLETTKEASPGDSQSNAGHKGGNGTMRTCVEGFDRFEATNRHSRLWRTE